MLGADDRRDVPVWPVEQVLWTVPAGVTQVLANLTAVAVGADGNFGSNEAQPGFGPIAEGTVALANRNLALRVVVGCNDGFGSGAAGGTGGDVVLGGDGTSGGSAGRGWGSAGAEPGVSQFGSGDDFDGTRTDFDGTGSGETIIVARGAASSYDNVGIQNPGGFGGCGNFDGNGYTLSQPNLAAAGLCPGCSVNHDGITYTWPSVPIGSPDNWVASGQTIPLTGCGSELGILGAADYGTATGDVTVHYTDGTSRTTAITVADWYDNQAAGGGDIMLTTPWQIPSGGALGPHNVSIDATTIPINPAKTVTSVTLPDIGSGVATGTLALHVFALGIASPPRAGPAGLARRRAGAAR